MIWLYGLNLPERLVETCPTLSVGQASSTTAYPVRPFRSRSKGHRLIRLTPVVTADLNRHLLVKALQKIEQLVRREAAEMPVHQVRHIGLCNAKNAGDLALLQ